MPDVMLVKLGEERTAKLSFIEGLTQAAAAENRDLSTNELELITRSKDRIKAIDSQIDVLATESDLSDQAQARLASLAGATVGDSSAFEYKTLGHYMRDYLRSIIGKGPEKAEAEENLRRYTRAASHITTGNFTGTFPDPLVGPLIDLINASRPLMAAVGVQPVPAGPTFRRPRLNDPNVDTGVAVQANQKDELVSQAFTLSSDTVNLTTLGGYVNVARQVTDWGIASMDLIIRQLAKRYARATERAALTEMSLSTSKVTLADAATGEVVTQAIFDAAALCYTETGELPTTLITGPLGWARLGGVATSGGQMAFPYLNPANAAGSSGGADTFALNPVGLAFVVTPAITDKRMWVLNGTALEAYEQVIGSLSVVEPSVLGVQVAYAGYAGFFRPAPDGAVLLAP